MGMYLFAQLYIRQAQRPDAMETWPSQNGELAGTSPSRHTQNGVCPLCHRPAMLHGTGGSCSCVRVTRCWLQQAAYTSVPGDE